MNITIKKVGHLFADKRCCRHISIQLDLFLFLLINSICQCNQISEILFLPLRKDAFLFFDCPSDFRNQWIYESKAIPIYCTPALCWIIRKMIRSKSIWQERKRKVWQKWRMQRKKKEVAYNISQMFNHMRHLLNILCA